MTLHRSREDGVSPTVAVILMVAVTVLLSVAVGAVVFDLAPERSDAQGTNTNADVAASTTTISTNAAEFQSLSGSGIDATNLEFIVKADAQSATVSITDPATGAISITGDASLINGTTVSGSGIGGDGVVSPGETVVISLNETTISTATTVSITTINSANERLIQNEETTDPSGTVATDSGTTSDALYTDWSHKKPITVSNPNAQDLSNYALRMNISYEPEMNANFSDVRFGQGGAKLDYWVEAKTDGDHAIVWVEAASLPASADADVTMYFGNASAKTVTSGDATFEMYDDFDDGAFDAEWEQLGPDSSAVYITASGWARTTDGDGARAYNTTRLNNYEVRGEYYLDSYQCYGNDFDMRVYDASNSVTGVPFDNGDNCNSRFVRLNGTDSGIDPPGGSGTTMRFDMREGTISLYRDGTFIASQDASDLTSGAYARFHIGRWWESHSSNTRVSVNWTFFRHVAPQEPTYTVGTKQTN